MQKKINVGIIGASGYSGEELIKLIIRHPLCSLKIITSRKYDGIQISEIFPRFSKYNFKFTRPDLESLLKSDVDVFFLALPHKVASEYAVPLYNAGKKIIDISADFRLDDESIYEKYYSVKHPAPELMKDAVYGLPEFYREKIKKADLIACPGCYPTSILLPSLPLLKDELVYSNDIVICSGSGVTGAGRKVDLPYIYPECNESFRAYGAVGHRHTPEIEQEMSKVSANKNIIINFIPHLIPMNRGMNSTLIFKLNDSVTSENIVNCYDKYYKNEEFIRLLGKGKLADTKNIATTNDCEIGFAVDDRTGKLIVTSCIDNLTKGASGQAVQCMNIMFGFDEATGLI
jgi:N-acetyl-gamma-glutamyl-phosphate reductase